jgi:cellulose 1,4-beta-cellobiosidase
MSAARAWTFSALSLAAGQQAGTQKENYHMPMQLSECTSSGCTASQKSLTLDANWRWTHSAEGYTNCYSGNSWDATLCPDGAACAENCALGAVPADEWSGTLGINKESEGVSLGFVTEGPYSKNVGSRLYMLESESQYKMFRMLNKEMSFDIDLSNMPCGLNAAVYFVEMDSHGDAGGANKAGAAYGTGYCDGQCARDVKFVKGEANIKDWKINTNDPYLNSGTGSIGSCCAEMDLWEANTMATAFTAHPSTKEGLFICNGDSECGAQDGDRYIAPTDRDGCDINSYRLGNKDFYGPGSSYAVDTTKKFTVVTQFHAPNGVLENIVQFYVQDGKRIDHQSYSGLPGTSETSEFCQAQKTMFGDRDDFTHKGGLKTMGEALDRGMVLVVSLWDDISIYMNWLDAYNGCDPTEPGCMRGPCDPEVGKPETLRNAHPDSSYSFLNLKVGDIDTTNPDVPPTPAPTPPSPVPPSPPSPPSPSGDCPGGSLSACEAACAVVTGAAYDACISVCKQDCPATTTEAPAPAPSPVPSGCPGGSLSECIKGCPTNPAIFATCVAHCEEECTPQTTTPAPPAGMCCWQDCETMSTCLPSDACSTDEDSCQSCSGIWCPASSLLLV